MNVQELNQLLQDTWTAGDFPKMGMELSIVGELLCESVLILAGDRVLDVGTASGNTALAAASRRAVVTGVDITPALLERARLRAAAEDLGVDFQQGDAMALASGVFIATCPMSACFPRTRPSPGKGGRTSGFEFGTTGQE